MKLIGEKPLSRKEQNIRSYRKNPKRRYAQHRAYLARMSPSEREHRRGKMREYNRALHSRQRLTVLSHYSGGKPGCACCGESHLEFLTIDHMNGGGQKHRQSIGGKVEAWLIRNGFPPGYQVLCLNCNHSLGTRGYCPHQKETVQIVETIR